MNKTLGWLTIATAFTVAACANKVTMNRSEAVPAAEGRVQVAKESNNMREIQLKVRHLAPPERVSAQASHYVVWLQPMIPEAGPSNLGVLSLGDNQEGQMDATTPYKSFQLFVTAEQDPQSTEPSGDRLLWTTVE